MTKFTNFLSSVNIVYSLNASLKELSGFKIGGSAAIICYPDCAEKAQLSGAYLRGACRSDGSVFPAYGFEEECPRRRGLAGADRSPGHNHSGENRRPAQCPDCQSASASRHGACQYGV